jgi:hypothetical protein
LDVPESERDKEKIERQKEPYLQSLQHDFRRKLRKAGFILEIFGIAGIFAYTTVAAFQWCATRDSNRIASELGALVHAPKQRLFLFRRYAGRPDPIIR